MHTLKDGSAAALVAVNGIESLRGVPLRLAGGESLDLYFLADDEIDRILESNSDASDSWRHVCYAHTSRNTDVREISLNGFIAILSPADLVSQMSVKNQDQDGEYAETSISVKVETNVGYGGIALTCKDGAGAETCVYVECDRGLTRVSIYPPNGIQMAAGSPVHMQSDVPVFAGRFSDERSLFALTNDDTTASFLYESQPEAETGDFKQISSQEETALLNDFNLSLPEVKVAPPTP